MQVAARVRPAAAPTWQTLVLAGLLVTVGSIHLVLTPEHFDEGAHFRLFFLGTAAFQFALAYALLLRPGPRVYRTALWASALIAATWMVTRLVPPPGASAPEPVEPWGVVATAAEVAAIFGIATLTPSPGARPSPAKRRALSLGAGWGFASLVLLSSGVVTVIRPGSWQGPSYLFRIYPLPSWRLTPAALTVPVCCGAPLVAFAGGAPVGTLFQLTPWLMAASLALLTTDAVRLSLRLGEAPGA